MKEALMPNNPLVSILLGSYNQKDYIRQALASALNQTYPNIEVVAYDNGSTDGTADILRSYAGDGRIKLLFSNDNIDQTKSTRSALAHCSGEFISILCGDDYYLPDKIQRQMERFYSLPPEYGVVYSPVYRLNVLTGQRWLEPCPKENGFVLKELLLQHHTAGHISWCAPLIRKECFARHPMHEDLSVEGESIFFRFALSFKFSYLDEPLTVMRDHLNNAGKATKQCADAILLILEKLAGDPQFPSEMVAPLNILRSSLFRNYGWQGIRIIEDKQWARKCFFLSAGYLPRQILHPKMMIGFCLSFLPQTSLRLINQLANRLVSHRENVVFKNSF